VKQVAYTAEGVFPPLQAFLGGVVGQEVLKAVTGKFSPLFQWVSAETLLALFWLFAFVTLD